MISSKIQPKLRFAVMCNGMILRKFQVEALRHLLGIPEAELVLLIVDGRETEPLNFASKLKAISRIKNTFWPIFTRLIRLEKGSPLELECAPAELAAVPKIRCKTFRKGKYSDYFEEADLEAIRAYKLDFIVKFAFGILRGGILQAARYGVWSYHHDDPDRYRGVPPAFWEVYFRDPVSGAILQRLTEKLDGGIILRKCAVKTIFHSYKQNLSNVLSASVVMPAQVVQDLLVGQADYVDGPPSTTTAPIFRLPTNLQVLVFIYTCVSAFLKRQIKGLLRVDSWNVGVVNSPIHRFTDPVFVPDVKWLPYRQAKRFIADPFAIAPGELLAEEFDYDLNRGYLVRLRQVGERLEVEKVLDDGRHLSYPYLLKVDGAVYMIPESAASREVALYRMDTDGSFTKVCTLLSNLAALDASVIRYEGRWWMFTTDADGPKDANLHIFYADELTGSWMAHPLNPVKMDVCSSRPAGTPFIHNGQLFRPAQNCSVTYGGAMALNRVEILTPTQFKEVTIRELRHEGQSRYRIGFHTLAAGDGITVVDGRCDETNLELVMRNMTHKLKRLLKLPIYSASRVSGYAGTATPER